MASVTAIFFFIIHWVGIRSTIIDLTTIESSNSSDISVGSQNWPTLIKGGQRQVANVLWHEEGLYVTLPYGYVDNLTAFYSDSAVLDVHKVRFPPRLYYPLSKANDAYYGDAVLSQISEQMEPQRLKAMILQNQASSSGPYKKVHQKKKQEQRASGWQIVKSFALSLLDQWLLSSTKDDPKARSANNVTNSTNETRPMRYLFLLGVLPTTFGSLYALGYTPLQIMVIGAYIVTSYFALVEKKQDDSQDNDHVSKLLEQVLNKVIEEDKEKDDEKEVDENYQPQKAFKLSALLDDKSRTFIQKFDSVFSSLQKIY